MAGYILCEICMNERVVGYDCEICGAKDQPMLNQTVMDNTIKALTNPNNSGFEIVSPSSDLFTIFVAGAERQYWDRSRIPHLMTYEDHLDSLFSALLKHKIAEWECGAEALAVSNYFSNNVLSSSGIWKSSLGFTLNSNLPSKTFRGKP